MSLWEFIPANYIFYKLNKAEGFLKKLSPKAEEQIFPVNKCIFTAFRLAWMFLARPDINNA